MRRSKLFTGLAAAATLAVGCGEDEEAATAQAETAKPAASAWEC